MTDIYQAHPRVTDQFQGKTVVVTGGAGFIGSHLSDALLSLGATVRVLDDLSAGSRDNLDPRVELVVGDIRDVSVCRNVISGADVVFHQAAVGSVPRSVKEPELTLSVNVAGTTNIFVAARDAGTKRVVYASSSSVYGDSAALPKKEGEEGDPLSPYALSKWMNEELASTFTRCFPEMSFVGLRYFNVYGPRQSPTGPYAAVIPKFFEACDLKRGVTINGDGGQSRDFTFVGDAVQANLLAAVAELPATNRAYNIGAGAVTTVNELAEQICTLTGNTEPPTFTELRPGDVRASLADITAARDLLGYAPRTELAHGLDLTRG